MNREWLEEYTDYLAMIDDLHRKRRKLPKVCDMVKGSSASHPYTKHAVTISGADRQMADRIDQDIRERQKKCEAVEKFVDGIKNPKMQNILRWRYIDGDSWPMIGQRIGTGEDAPRKRAERFLKKFFD